MTLEIERIGTDRAQQSMGMIAASYVMEDHPYSRKKEDLWVLNPRFQRGAVWSLKQKRAWIESMLMGIGLPSIFVNRFPSSVCPHPDYGWTEIVIDGQQRLRATAEFMQSKFQVRGEYFKDQDIVFRRGFTNGAGMCQVVYCAYETEKECAELYLKLLQAGTAHTTDEIKKAKEFVRRGG
jgi:hypothetical protein